MLLPALFAALLAVATPETPIPVGVTNLVADVSATVGFQRFGEAEETLLGYGWNGFDGGSGVYATPEPATGGRQPLFVHCPWVGGTGTAFLEYRLALPRTSRVRLALSYCLRASASHSDGVTWRVRIDEQPVWEANGTWKTWQEADVDLAAFAGRVVRVRLEVDPGPARNSTEDWALWGGAVVCAGSEAEVAAARVEAERARAVRRRADLQAAAGLADADLRAFSTVETDSARPRTAGPVENRIEADGARYRLLCRAADEQVEYRVDPAAGLPAGIEVWVDGKPLVPQPFAGGARAVLGGAERARAVPKLLEAAVTDGTLRCRYEYREDGTAGVAALAVAISPQGKSLQLQFQGSPGGFAGFRFEIRGGETVPTPFVVGTEPRRHASGLYVAAVNDLFAGDASGVGQNAAVSHYDLRTDGSRRTLRDTFYLTVSRRYEETLPNIPQPASPFLAELAQRCVLDAWNGGFDADREWLERMAVYGVTNLLVIKHVWQRDGYDQTYPNVFPARADQGGDEALRRLATRAIELGHRFCVHENFYDYYPNAEAFRAEHCALDSRGQPQAGWDNGSVVARILKPTLLMTYARQFSPEVRSRYGCNADYHDIMPTWRVDFDAAVEHSGCIRETHGFSRELFDFDRTLFAGPVVCEAAEAWMAGAYDGGCNHGVDTYRTPMAPLFELLKVHPRMSNHGFGYYERWLPWGYGPGWSTYRMTDRELDAYRAVQVAFGRTGFLGQQLMPDPHALVREYHLMQAFGRAYTGRALERLAWWVEDGDWQGWVDSATAARYGLLERLRATYEGGQQVYVNRADRDWTVDGLVLPANGSATQGPRATARTVRLDGQIADFAIYGDVLFADARSHTFTPADTPAPVTPSVAAFVDRGDGAFELTLDWQAGRRLDRSLTVFWHFVADGRICLQSDHAPTTPTSAWPPNSVQHDGPVALRVPAAETAAEYEFRVGLYDKAGRVPLAQGRTEMALGTLRVERRDGRITALRLDTRPAAEQPGTRPEPYLVDANREHRVLDFGPVATNGAIVMRTGAGGRALVPVPMGEPLRVGLALPAAQVEAFAADGRTLGALPTRETAGKLWFDVPADTARVLVR